MQAGLPPVAHEIAQVTITPHKRMGTSSPPSKRRNTTPFPNDPSGPSFTPSSIIADIFATEMEEMKEEDELETFREMEERFEEELKKAEVILQHERSRLVELKKRRLEDKKAAENPFR